MHAEPVATLRAHGQTSWRYLHVAAACSAFVTLVTALSFFAVFTMPGQPAWERYDPEDDGAWAAISLDEVSWEVVEQLEGATAQRVIEVLGAPVHSRRRTEASDRCVAVYLYGIKTAGMHSVVGLCIDRDGLVNGSVGQHKIHLGSQQLW